MLNTIDFRNVSDTGEPEPTAIQQVTDGEPAGQVALRRPTENNRSRTDVLRQVLREHVVLQDYQAQLLTGGGTITFDGAKATYSGKVHLGADLMVIPFATPGGAGTAPYVQSTYATRRLIGADVVNDILLFTSRYRQWQRPIGGAAPNWAAEADQISVEIVHTGTLSVTVGGAANKQTNIYITINYGVTTCQQVIDAVAADLAANKLVVVTYAGGSTSAAPAPRFTTTEWAGDYSARFLRGGAPGLVHQISDDTLNNVSAGFFNLNVENPLKKGDTLAIWYDALVNLAATGGRLQSTPENLNIAIPATALFNTRREPEKIPNCIPICKCVDDNTLVFVDGSRIIRGTPASLWWDSTHMIGGSLVDYSGWTRIRYAPGAHVPPTNVQMSLDNVDDIFEAILSGAQAFVAATGNNGITATGQGTHAGVYGTGGATTGTGLEGHGGAPDGGGVSGWGVGTGTGVYGEGGAGGGPGVVALGKGAAQGVYATGGATNGTGIEGHGGGTSAPTAGPGVRGYGNANGANGVEGYGAGTDGDGVYGLGSGVGDSVGVRGRAAVTGGDGIQGEGRITGAGVKGLGGAYTDPDPPGIGVIGIGGEGDGAASRGGAGVKGTGGTVGGNGVEGYGTVGAGSLAQGGSGVFGQGAFIDDGSDHSGVGIVGWGGGPQASGVAGYGGGDSTTVVAGIGVTGTGGSSSHHEGSCGVAGQGGASTFSTGGTGVYGNGGVGPGGTRGAGVSGYGRPGIFGDSDTGVGVSGKSFGLNTDESLVIPVPLYAGRGTQPDKATPSPWFLIKGVWEATVDTGGGTLYVPCSLPHGFRPEKLYLQWYVSETPDSQMMATCSVIRNTPDSAEIVYALNSSILCTRVGTTNWDNGLLTGTTDHRIDFDATHGDWLRITVTVGTHGASPVDWSVTALCITGKISAPGCYHAGRHVT